MIQKRSGRFETFDLRKLETSIVNAHAKGSLVEEIMIELNQIHYPNTSLLRQKVWETLKMKDYQAANRFLYTRTFKVHLFEFVSEFFVWLNPKAMNRIAVLSGSPVFLEYLIWRYQAVFSEAAPSLLEDQIWINPKTALILGCSEGEKIAVRGQQAKGDRNLYLQNVRVQKA